MSLLDPLARWFSLPLGRRHAVDCLRIGRHAVERWSPSGQGRGGFHLEASAPLPPGGPPHAGHLAAAIAQVCPLPIAKQKTAIDVVLESAWLPVILVDTGGALVSDVQAQALVRHRLQRLYDSGRDPVAAWELRVDFLAGDSRALGYGLSPHVRQALEQAAGTTGLKWRTLTPALAWGWDWTWQGPGQKTELWHGPSGWWGWMEQDRLLLAQVVNPGSKKRRITSLHPGLAGGSGARHDVLQQVQAEAHRLGLLDTGTSAPNVTIGAWATAASHAQAPDARLHWLCVGQPVAGNANPSSPRGLGVVRSTPT